jgi:outer membrane protein assembly factor BamA
MKRPTLLACLFFATSLFAGAFSLKGQSPATDSVPGTAPKRDHKTLDIFPAISYSPETKLTLGAIGIAYLDLRKGDPGTPLSNIEFLGVYTLAKQILIESRWEMFGSRRQWRLRGELLLQRYPDRNYGIGNDASVLLAEIDDAGQRDTVNYLNFNSDRIKFSPIALYRLRPNLYAGLQTDLEYLFKYDEIPERYTFLGADSSSIRDIPVAGLRSGIGVQVLYDDRDNLINPLKGSFIEFNSRHYTKWMGSDFRFDQLALDVRRYVNPWKNHTVALRCTTNLEFTKDAIPLRALSRVGGHKFIRGYFRGTYQDHHLLAFEAEYRLPLWRDGQKFRRWHIWERFGLVGFLGGAQVFRDAAELRMDHFNLAAGGGLRILLNAASRANVRIDYAIALRPDSDGPGKRQRGFYFFLGEAF